MFYIALCGPPKSGKSTVQEILQRRWGVVPVDDGRIIRDLVKRAFSLTEDDVSTQEGKIRRCDISGSSSFGGLLGNTKILSNRELLGKLSRGMETEFGRYIIPLLTVREFCEPSEFNRFSFGSVRRHQGWFYKDSETDGSEGIVIEILKEKPTGHSFDEYDQDAVDYTILNNGSMEDLENQLVELLDTIINSYPKMKDSVQTSLNS